jgi:hypothetical protein
MQQAQISDGRKATYYIGVAMMILGVVLFFSFFFSIASMARNPYGSASHQRIIIIPHGQSKSIDTNQKLHASPWESTSPNDPFKIVIRPIIGIIFIVVGGVLMGIGQRGLAGSGIVLDPNQARDDLKPWSQMAGGMLDDALSQSETVGRIVQHKDEVIKIRCQKCGALNDEDAKYCDECGAKI